MHTLPSSDFRFLAAACAFATRFLNSSSSFNASRHTSDPCTLYCRAFVNISFTSRSNAAHDEHSPVCTRFLISARLIGLLISSK